MPGCIQPMSSPMMKRMLGFCWAEAGLPARATTVNSASRASKTLRVYLITSLLLRKIVSCILLPPVEQEAQIRRDACQFGPLGLQLPQRVHPLPIGELEVGQIQDHWSRDL